MSKYFLLSASITKVITYQQRSIVNSLIENLDESTYCKLILRIITNRKFSLLHKRSLMFSCSCIHTNLSCTLKFVAQNTGAMLLSPIVLYRTEYRLHNTSCLYSIIENYLRMLPAGVVPEPALQNAQEVGSGRRCGR